MNAQFDVTAMAGILALHHRVVPTDVREGPSGTATCNYVAKDGDGCRWFVKAYPEHADLGAEGRALELAEFAALGGVPVPAMRQTLDGDLIAVEGGLAVAVTAFAEGAEAAEGGLHGEQWAAVGATVGRLHRTLARHPDGPPRRAPAPHLRCRPLERRPPQTSAVRARWTEAPHDGPEHRGHHAKARCPNCARSSDDYHYGPLSHGDGRSHRVRGQPRHPG
ncbi:phosphotransferase [Streptomyces bobili]|uniref:phosphotransferase n=1 Tax=Streptomyces bobili TaxID=67280 RepID=UPI0037FB54AA